MYRDHRDIIEDERREGIAAAARARDEDARISIQIENASSGPVAANGKVMRYTTRPVDPVIALSLLKNMWVTTMIVLGDIANPAQAQQLLNTLLHAFQRVSPPAPAEPVVELEPEFVFETDFVCESTRDKLATDMSWAQDLQTHVKNPIEEQAFYAAGFYGPVLTWQGFNHIAANRGLMRNPETGLLYHSEKRVRELESENNPAGQSCDHPVLVYRARPVSSEQAPAAEAESASHYTATFGRYARGERRAEPVPVHVPRTRRDAEMHLVHEG